MNVPDAGQSPQVEPGPLSGVPGVVAASIGKYMRSSWSTGLAIGVYAAGRSDTFFFGSLEKNRPDAPNEETLFEIGSISKVFTTTLLADMHFKNEVRLDDPVNAYLPAAAKLPSRGGVEVTLRHLATHTSGLPRLPVNLRLWKANPKNPYVHYTVDDLYAGLAKTRPRRTPGTKTQYSNLGMGLLGHVLALAAGTNYETLVKERICRPLGMNDTTITLSEDQERRLAPGHSLGRPTSNWDLPTLAGAGALRSTLRDMLCFLRANVEPASTPLEPAVKLAHQIQVEGKYRVYLDYGAMVPAIVLGMAGLFYFESFGLSGSTRVAILLGLPGLLYYVWPLSLDTMGLGWHIDDDLADKTVLWHNGATGGYSSYLGYFPDTGEGVVLLANSNNNPDSVGRRILKNLRQPPE